MDRGTVKKTEVSESVLVETDEVSPGSAVAMHGLLNAPEAAPQRGDALPPLWHWMAFLPRGAQSELGPDGHPLSGSLFHSDENPQRMFAGARITWSGVAKVGEPLTRRSRVVSIVEKQGRTGSLLFAVLEHIIENSRATLIHEEQDLVYRKKARPTMSDEELPEVDEVNEWRWNMDLTVDSTSLFRFSALTYNAHRIHYDRPYAVEEEGFPGLVVQGPYQAIGLAELCRRYDPKRTMSSFSFRAERPAFDGRPLKLRGNPDGVAQLEAINSANRRTMVASATFKA
jgi:3-methylfumaryl-CoA hydratase